MTVLEELTYRGLLEHARVLEQLLDDRELVLRAIPECPLHGPCVPHALDWIATQKERAMSDNHAVTIKCSSAEDAENLKAVLDLVEGRSFIALAGALLRAHAGGERVRRFEFINDVERPDSGRVSIETRPDGNHHLEASRTLGETEHARAVRELQEQGSER